MIVLNLHQIAKITTTAASLVALFALSACGAPTYGTGRSPEFAVIEELTGTLAGGGGNKEPIEYSARSELVLPPSAQLPSPQEQQKMADTAANWPVDPDKNRAENDGEIPEEFRKGRLAPGSTKRGGNASPVELADMTIEQRLEAQQKFREQRAAMGPGTANQRRYLTDPPTEYRQPSGNAPAPETLATDTAPKTLFGSLWRRWAN